jgi:hypothetical protein
VLKVPPIALEHRHVFVASLESTAPEPLFRNWKRLEDLAELEQDRVAQSSVLVGCARAVGGHPAYLAPEAILLCPFDLGRVAPLAGTAARSVPATRVG